VTFLGCVQGSDLPGQVVIPRSRCEFVEAHRHTHPKGVQAAGAVRTTQATSGGGPLGLSLAPLSSGEGKAGGLVVEQGLKDGIGEAALEYAKCLASAVPTALAPFDHPFGRRMPTGLGECDAV
jgi:hypothetical protein